MAKNPNVYKFEIIERIITEVDFTTKEEVLDFAKKVIECVDKNNNFKLLYEDNLSIEKKIVGTAV